MNEERFNEIIEASWRRPLTRDEQLEVEAYLACHPDQQSLLDEEQALTASLSRLPAAPVPSNFTARVWHAIEAEERREERTAGYSWNWARRWIPKFATVGLVAILGLTGVNLYQYQNRKKAEEAFAAVSPLATALPAPVLEDFEAIHHLRTAPVDTDEDLVAVLLK